MTVVLDLLDLGGFSWNAKVYRATWESGLGENQPEPSRRWH